MRENNIAYADLLLGDYRRILGGDYESYPFAGSTTRGWDAHYSACRAQQVTPEQILRAARAVAVHHVQEAGYE